MVNVIKPDLGPELFLEELNADFADLPITDATVFVVVSPSWHQIVPRKYTRMYALNWL